MQIAPSSPSAVDSHMRMLVVQRSRLFTRAACEPERASSLVLRVEPPSRLDVVAPPIATEMSRFDVTHGSRPGPGAHGGASAALITRIGSFT